MAATKYFLSRALLAIALLPALPAWAGPQIQSWHTANGARVLFVAAPELPMLDVRVVFDAAGAREAKPGVASLTSSMLTQGAGEWNADQIAERMEAVGAELSVGSLRDMAWISVRTLTEDKALEVSTETLAAIIAAPRFEAAALERNRKAMQAGLRLEEQNPGSLAKKAFFKAVYGQHPYAIHSGGTKDSLAAMAREDLKSHFKQLYVAKNAVLVEGQAARGGPVGGDPRPGGHPVPQGQQLRDVRGVAGKGPGEGVLQTAQHEEQRQIHVGDLRPRQHL